MRRVSTFGQTGERTGRRRALRLLVMVVVLGSGLWAATTALTATTDPEAAPSALVGGVPPAGAQEEPPVEEGIPRGCPGGPPGRPLPGTECPDGTVPAAPRAPAGCRFGPDSPPDVDTAECPDGSTPRDRAADRALRNIFGFEENEGHPLSAYDIGCDEGSWNAFLRKMWCGAQSLPFSMGKWAIGLGTDVLAWALEFRVAEVLTPVAGVLSRVYSASLIGPLRLEMLAWTLVLFVAGWNIMRGRTANGLREILTSALVAILGGMILANPTGYLEGSVELAQNTSGAVLESVDGALNSEPGQEAEAIRLRLDGTLRRSFVAEPYDLINWGEPLSGSCASARDRILQGGPWGSDDRPREIMREAGCERAAEFNATPSDERAAAALTVSIASILVTILMMLMALAVFAAQITLVALFSVASFIWVIALFPGDRGVLWWWLSRLIWSVLVTFASIFLLSWVSITVTALLDATTDLSIIQRCLIVIVLVGVAYRFRSAVDKAADSAAKGLSKSLSGVTSGGGGGGFLAVGAAAAGGAALAGPLSVRPRQIQAAAFAASGSAAAGARRGARLAVAGAQGTRNVGASVAQGTRAAGATTAAVVAAPLTLPQRMGQMRGRATARSNRVRQRLDNARAAARDARHPIASARAQRAAAERSRQETFDWM